MKRHYTPLLHELLGLFPCVAIVGVRQCGKTTLLQELPPLWRRYDMEKSDDLEIITRDPDLFFRLNPNQVAIDECQLHPELFPALRIAIDADRHTPGRFVITGSSSPDLLQSISESLAGRIAIIELAPFSLTEAHASPPSELYQLIGEQKPQACRYLVKDFGTSKSPKSTRQRDNLLVPWPPCVRAASPHHRKLGAGYAALPQMA